MAVSLMPVSMIVMPVVMSVPLRGASSAKMREGVEEDVSQESSHGKGDQVVDHGVAERGFGQEEQVEQVDHKDGDH
jgi:hypothetical protein